MSINSPHPLNGKVLHVALGTNDKVRKEIEQIRHRLNSIDGDIAATLNDIKVFCEKTLISHKPLACSIDLIEVYSRKLERLKADYANTKETYSMLEYFLRD